MNYLRKKEIFAAVITIVIIIIIIIIINLKLMIKKLQVVTFITKVIELINVN